MANEEKRLILKKIKTDTSKNGKEYLKVFDENDDIYTAFDDSIIKNLRAHEGDKVLVGVKESNGFRNIRSWIKGIEKNASSKQGNNKQQTQKVYENGSKGLTKGMKVSYAKDIFCSLNESHAIQDIDEEPEDIMKTACNLVRLAELAFSE